MRLKGLISVIFILFLFTHAHAGEISVRDVKGIFSMRPDTGAIFLKVENKGRTDDAIIGARVDIKGVVVELHDVKNGQMYKIDRIPVPAKTTVELKRGGLHIMLFNLPVELGEGQEFKLTLIFEKAGEITVPAKLYMSKGKGHHHH